MFSAETKEVNLDFAIKSIPKAYGHLNCDYNTVCRGGEKSYRSRWTANWLGSLQYPRTGPWNPSNASSGENMATIFKNCKSTINRSRYCIRCGAPDHKIDKCSLELDVFYAVRRKEWMRVSRAISEDIRDACPKTTMRILQVNLNHCEIVQDLLMRSEKKSGRGDCGIAEHVETMQSIQKLRPIILGCDKRFGLATSTFSRRSQEDMKMTSLGPKLYGLYTIVMLNLSIAYL